MDGGRDNGSNKIDWYVYHEDYSVIFFRLFVDLFVRRLRGFIKREFTVDASCDGYCLHVVFIFVVITAKGWRRAGRHGWMRDYLFWIRGFDFLTVVAGV